VYNIHCENCKKLYSDETGQNMVRGLDKDWNLISRYGREIIPVLAEQ
jgi:hypothetical protein